MTTNVNHPYFNPDEVAYLCDRQRGKMTESQESKARIQACSFIEVVGSKIGFPRATIATAQTLFNRFHMFYPWKEFNYSDVTMATLYVSSKLHDTLKKPRDLLMVSYAVRFPELAAKVKHGGGEVDIDPSTIEADRRRLLAIERLVMETVCFNFRVRLPFSYVIKVARELKVGKHLTKLAWRLAIDSHRTMAPLQYPPHVIALASIFLAALLDLRESVHLFPTEPEDRSSQEIVEMLAEKGQWEQKFHAQTQDLEEICHFLLDVLLYAAETSQSSSNTTSPQTPQTPASPSHSTPYPSNPSSQHSKDPPPQPLFPVEQLTRTKIFLRERPHPYHPRERGLIPGRDQSLFFEIEEKTAQEGVDGAGETVLNASWKSEGTVRFLFGPEI
ncbi:cyclin-like protein [Cantharellus anzutake]|uniref:cyclin-like protein n=1 Tax=Cantharellus anzutake TaxID=1750568 RepID=UPI001905F117|nr:cyclin-like protein [Cantharellus anzutake]KAF8333429.1 cyclin-like protein [Cantharellus anzutake]